MNEREIFTDALQRTDQTDRATFLDNACGSDAALRARVEKLLAMHETDDSVLDHRPVDMLQAFGKNAALRDDEADITAQIMAGLRTTFEPSTRPGSLGRLAHYEVLEVLGHGGCGIVLKAMDDKLQRIVAVKILAPHLALTSPARKRFLREARAAAQVRHEHVVQIYAVEEAPLPYLVMEFIDGQTLQQKLDADGPLDALEVVRLGLQIAQGLAAAHAKGLIHRDIKPANILLEAGPDSRVKLTDFGLARTTDDASLTGSGIIAGTPMYMAPEQARCEAIDHRADLFSFGSVLYTMCCGRPPFRAPTTIAVLKRVTEDTPRPVREVIPEVPEGLCAVIALLHQKDPANRYATATQAAEALACCLTDPVPAPTVRARPWTKIAVAVAAAVLLFAASWIVHEMTQSAPVNGHGPEIKQQAKGDGAPPKEPVKPQPLPGLSVTSLLDDGSEGTLRWAVDQVNSKPGPDAITFDAAVFRTPQTITLTQGPLSLTDSDLTTITGPQEGLTISGDNKCQVFVIGGSNTPTKALIVGLTVAHGKSDEKARLGGGVYCRAGATLTMLGCTLRDNVADLDGGGGVFNNNGTVTLTNCTFTRNTGKSGGAVKNYGGTARLTMLNCTIAGNFSDRGGGIFTNGAAHTTVYNSIFFDNTGFDFGFGEAGTTIGDHNLSGDLNGPGAHSLTNVDARLGAFGRHGGPTETFLLLPGGPAIDAGGNEHVPAGLGTDQRGRPRLVNGTVDIGAVEFESKK